MDKEAFQQLIERLVQHGFDESLAGKIAVAIGTTPELNLDGDIEVKFGDTLHVVPWSVYEG